MAMPGMPFDFAISVGVRHGDSTLGKTLDAILARRHADIVRILRSYGTPLVNETGTIVSPPASSNELDSIMVQTGK
jgi:hypothetical protein